MAQATSQLHPQSVPLNRRRVLAGAVTAAAIAVGAAPAGAALAAAVSAAPAPSQDGRAVLRLIAEQVAINKHGGDPDPEGVRLSELYDQIEEIGRRITARPIAGLTDLVDRAILAAWACQPNDGVLIPHDPGSAQTALITGILDLGGVDVKLCNSELA